MHPVKSLFNEKQNDEIYVQENFSSVLASWLYILMLQCYSIYISS
jgi:hypothetical protein